MRSATRSVAGCASWPAPRRTARMLELYHSINSVCAQKVRIALAEKGLQATEHLMTLRSDQFDPAYMKLNPNAVVPTLIHDGNVIVESSVEQQIMKRMTEGDWAPFKSIQADPWPKVRDMLAA